MYCTNFDLTYIILNQPTSQSRSHTTCMGTSLYIVLLILVLRFPCSLLVHCTCIKYSVVVFNPLAQSYHNTSLANSYRKNEQEKRWAYDQRVREVEQGCFSPLVFSVSRGMGPSATVVYKRLATMISTNFNQQYSQTINWLRCRLTFSLQSEIMCIRGSRSSAGHSAHPILSEAAIDHALYEGHGTM